MVEKDEMELSELFCDDSEHQKWMDLYSLEQYEGIGCLLTNEQRILVENHLASCGSCKNKFN